ncbi:MAG: GNAT family protein [Bacteroidetes bacterium]|jgi:RimJ/RimL family protein N-acetyltransferase|nr:GNAT family protein [Bacteroidota bacterium]
MELLTDRLRIRPIEPSDAAALFSYRSDAGTNKYQGWIPKSLDDVKTFIEKTSDKINVPGTWYQFVIQYPQAQHMLIGDIGVHFYEKDISQVEIGCTLSIAYQKMGIATEALKSVIEFLFTDLKKQKIYASLDPRNTDSVNLVCRLGFRKEAHLKDQLFLNGEWVDDVIYVLSGKDWKR